MLPVWGHTGHALSQLEKTCLQQIRKYCTVCAEVLEPVLVRSQALTYTLKMRG